MLLILYVLWRDLFKWLGSIASTVFVATNSTLLEVFQLLLVAYLYHSSHGKLRVFNPFIKSVMVVLVLVNRPIVRFGFFLLRMWGLLWRSIYNRFSTISSTMILPHQPYLRLLWRNIKELISRVWLISSMSFNRVICLLIGIASYPLRWLIRVASWCTFFSIILARFSLHYFRCVCY